MPDLIFHILDIAERDEKVVSETDSVREVAYESGDEEADSDIEAVSQKRYKNNADGNEELVIHLFGSTAEGKSVRVDCKGFRPFFYVRCPQGANPSQCLSALWNYLEKTLRQAANVVKLRPVKRKLMYGYTAGHLFDFIEISVPSKKLFRNIKNLFLDDKCNPKTKWPLSHPFQGAPKIYEANLDPYLRFMHLRNIKPCDWILVKEGLEEAEEQEDGSLVIEGCDWTLIEPCTNPPAPTAPFKLLSWDIECWSQSGDFPVPSKDPVIQIGCILTQLGSKDTTKHIFVLGTCNKIAGVDVRTYKTEQELLTGWFDWVCSQGIDIMTGYNIFGFDEQYVWKRCEALKLVNHPSIQAMNRLCEYGGEMRLEEKRLSSSAMGDNFLHLWNTQGRLRIDLYHAIKRQYPMASYKLDDVSRAFLNDPVTKCTSNDDEWRIEVTDSGFAKQSPAVGRALVLLNSNGDSLCEKCVIKAIEGNVLVIETPLDTDEEDVSKWAIVKDDLSPQEMFKKHTGSAADRATIAAYCVQDCQLVLDIFRKLDTFNNAAAMANVCSVPIAHIFLRGQGIKIESLIFKYCHENNFAIEVLPSPGFGTSAGPTESYEGAIVLDPTPGFYTTPVGVADFASLYPSTIISENISHDTLVWVKDYSLDGKLLQVKYGNEFMAYDQPNKVPFTDIEYDIWGVKEGDTRKNPEKVKTGIRVCRYAQDKQGAIPIIIAQLLDARKRTRNLIKTEKDPFKQALLDSQQNAYKITANSLYGQLGSGTFKIRQQELAASVTAYGRKQIMFAKAAIEKFYGESNPKCSCKVVYGDTDSLFICFNPKGADGKPLEGREALLKTIELTEEAGKLVTQGLKPPHDFEFDKVYWPFLIFSKKRYVGHKYEEAEHYTQASMGIALKRRDYAPIVKKIYGGAIHILLTEKDVAKAANFVKTSCKELIEGKYGLGPLTITKSLKAEYADPTRIAHKVLADRIAVRSPGNAPAAGERIGFVYVQPAAGQLAADLQGDRIETPAYIREKGLKPDYMFYIDHQISNPVCQVFGLLVEGVPGYVPQLWDENPDKELKQRENVAYDLLFKDAIQTNQISAKRNFVQLLGGTVASTKSSAMKASASPTTVKKRAVGGQTMKQSVLDSFFADSVLSAARTKASKAAAKKTAMEVDS